MTATRPRGRPRGFDSFEALEAAMRVFWTMGYEAASVDVLCRETGMPRASLYRVYDGKEGLFLAAVAHYAETRLAPVIAALGPRGSLREDMTAFFHEVIKLATAGASHRGCLISCALADAAGANDRFRRELDKRFSLLEKKIAERLLRGGRARPGVLNPEAEAMVVASIARGLMLRARSGASMDSLRRAAAAAAEFVV